MQDDWVGVGRLSYEQGETKGMGEERMDAGEKSSRWKDII